MAEINRNALLKELSRKLEDQFVDQSGGVFRTIPDNSRIARNDARRKNAIEGAENKMKRTSSVTPL